MPNMRCFTRRSEDRFAEGWLPIPKQDTRALSRVCRRARPTHVSLPGRSLFGMPNSRGLSCPKTHELLERRWHRQAERGPALLNQSSFVFGMPKLVQVVSPDGLRGARRGAPASLALWGSPSPSFEIGTSRHWRCGVFGMPNTAGDERHGRGATRRCTAGSRGG